MNFIEFLFKLIARFIDLDPAKQAAMQNDAQVWCEANKDHKIWGKVLKYQNEWYIKVLLCFVLMFSVKWISRWMVADNTTGKDEDFDDEEMDEEDEFALFQKERRAAKSNASSLF